QPRGEPSRRARRQPSGGTRSSAVRCSKRRARHISSRSSGMPDEGVTRAPDRANLVACLQRQARGCGLLGSSFYEMLIGHLIADVEADGPTWGILEGYSGEPFEAAVGLRFLGAVHRLVLEGRVPALARHYPSAGGDGDATAAWRQLPGPLPPPPAQPPA